MILSTETSPMSHVTVSVVGGSKSYLRGSDPKNRNLRCNQSLKGTINLMILSTETSPMSHVTASVVGGSLSYLTGSDPKT